MRVNWLYFLGDKNKKGNKEKVFLYGLSLPTNFNKIVNSKPQKIGDIANHSVYLYYSINSEDYIYNNSTIEFNKVNSFLSSELNIVNQRKTIQNNQHYNFEENLESPIGSTVNMNVFFTNDFFEYESAKYLDENNKSELKEILKILAEDSSQSFNSNYSKRLGCFELAEIQPWAETSVPFNLSISRETLNKYIFNRKNIEQSVFIHLIVYSTLQEILLDEIKMLEKGINEIIFNTEIKNDVGYEYWVFDNNGKLLHKDKAYWMLGLNMQMNMIGQTIKKVPYEVKNKKAKTQDVTISTPNNLLKIDYPDNKSENEIDNRCNIIYKFTQAPKTDQKGNWFSASENNVTNVIKYINSLLTSNNTNLTIIDPFFSRESIYPLLHLQNSTLKINIISCWGNEDPDTSEQVTKDDIKTNVTKTLESVKDYNLPASRLNWYDFTPKLFHDRFMIIENRQTHDKQIFMLSNSLNNLLKTYDFCILSLEGTVKEQANKYLDDLISNCSNENRIYPTVSK